MMKLALVIFLSLFVTYANAQNLTGYTLIFNENFGSASVSTNPTTSDGHTWYTQTKQCGCYTPTDGNPAVQYSGAGTQTSPFFILPGGGLDMRLGLQTLSGTPTWVGPSIGSAAPDGTGFSFQYGYLEAKVKFPPGQIGMWPALWLMPVACLAGYPNPPDCKGQAELDVYELFGGNGNDKVYSWTLHNWVLSYVEASQVDYNSLFQMDDGNWHVVGLMWTQQTITIYVDGVIVGAAQTPQPAYNQPFYILLSFGMGSGWPTVGLPNPSHYYVQYVRVYKPPH